jgi:drug/metabolite transporter (DMT)-like permease
MTVETPVSSMMWVLSGSFIGSFGAVLLKAGAVRLERNWVSLLGNWRLVVGAAVYLLSSLFYVRGIAHGELSVLYPLVAIGYLWTILWSRVFFGEPLTKIKFVAVFIILAGVAMLNTGVATK